MFIKIIRHQNSGVVEHQPTEMHHAISYELYELEHGVRLEIVLINGDSVIIDLPSKKTLKNPSKAGVEDVYGNTREISVSVMNDNGKTIQTYNS